jgi:hypothetical protein
MGIDQSETEGRWVQLISEIGNIPREGKREEIRWLNEVTVLSNHHIYVFLPFLQILRPLLKFEYRLGVTAFYFYFFLQYKNRFTCNFLKGNSEPFF